MKEAQAYRLLAFLRVPHRQAVETDWTQRRTAGILESTSPYIDYSWNGHELVITPAREPYEIAHEAMHFLEASRARRKLVEFGLGRGPYQDLWRDSNANYVRLHHVGTHMDADVIEIQVCVLQIWLYHALKLNWQELALDLGFDADWTSWRQFREHKDNEEWFTRIQRRPRLLRALRSFVAQERARCR